MAAVLKTGARFTLRRQRATEEAVIYQGLIELPGNVTHEQTLTFAPETGEFTASGGESAPAWTITWLHTLAKRMGRAAVKSGTWPRKSKQWKDDPAS